jgi:para-nitrobenzyl esterase
LNPDQIDELQKIPAAQLLMLAQGGGCGETGAPNAGAGPVVDGRILPANAIDPVAPALSADIPFMTGSTETEGRFFQPPPVEPLDDAGLRAAFKQTGRTDDAGADRLIAIYRKNRPKASNRDLALIVASDGGMKQGPDTQAERKAAQARGPVYKYFFQWYSPVREGRLRSYHCLEIPFVSNNVNALQAMTGTGRDQSALAEKLAGAWIAFARNGNPNHKALPSSSHQADECPASRRGSIAGSPLTESKTDRTRPSVVRASGSRRLTLELRN